MIPTVFVLIPFVVACVMVTWQYREIDSRRRILNLRFLIAVLAIVAIFYYVFHVYYYPDDRRTSWIFQALSLAWLAWSWWLLRRMPPSET